jgi:large repetitive protein
VWSVSLAPGAVPAGEYPATLTATTTDAMGRTTSASHDFRVDTLVNQSDIHADTAAGDGIINAREAAGGFVLTGQTEAGARSVMVRLEGISRAATVAADGSWSVSFAGGEIGGGEFFSAATVTVIDAAGNRRVDSAVIEIDTVGPDAASITSALHTPAGLLAFGTAGGETGMEIHLVGADGSADKVDFTTLAQGGLGNLHLLDQPAPDGSALIVTNMDAAGNQTDTLVLFSNQGEVTLDLATASLDGFEIAAIDLQYAPNADLVITESQLRALAEGTDALVVHGDAQDSVTAIGAQSTGESVDIGGHSYSIWTLGDAGATLIIDDEITVNT